jgi:hypothetical protein
MKKMLLIIGLAGCGAVGFSAKTIPAPARDSGPVIQFDAMVHDFGTLREGDVVNYVFKFTNKGSGPLIVEDVEQPCGCTIPKWNKAPIMPGQQGEIKVIFNSIERPGIFRKTLTVKTNMAMKVNEPILLMIKGNVLTKKQWKARTTTTSK